MLDSKFGYKAVDKLFISAIFSFKTQFTPGFKYPSEDNDSYILESMFMAPGNISLGLGADYKPFDFLSVNFAPVTSNLVVVTEQSLREKYGNAIDQVARFELGAQLKVDFSKNFGDKFSLQTSVTLFSDFLDSPQNIKVNWDLVADLKLSKVFSINLRTNLIYDDKILIDNGDGNLCPRADNIIYFSTDGNVRLRALCNGDPTDLTPFSANYMRAFSGKLLAVVEADGDAKGSISAFSGARGDKKISSGKAEF